MKIVLYTHAVSPHEMPLLEAIWRKHIDWDVKYVVDGRARKELCEGWSYKFSTENIIVLDDMPKEQRGIFWERLLDGKTILFYGCRENEYLDIFVQSEAVVCYVSERWLKPSYGLPGVCHFLSSTFRNKLRWYRQQILHNPKFYYFAEGIYAAKDMAMMCGIKVRDFEKVPGAKVSEKIRLWGYFVQSAIEQRRRCRKLRESLRVLWVGRMVKLKRVDTIIRAIARMIKLKVEGSRLNVQLTLVGDGPERKRLEKMAEGLPIYFVGKKPMLEVRKLMREHDVFVFPSNAYEGWGAVVNEALEEGMRVVGSVDAGAAATMLPPECLFNGSNAKMLADILCGEIPKLGIGKWSVNAAAQQIEKFIEETML